MTAIEDAATALVAAGVLALVGYLLRYREWTGLVAAFTSAVDERAAPTATARAAGKGALLMALPLALYGVATLAGVPRRRDVAFVTVVAVALVCYRTLHWVHRAGDGRRNAR